MLRIIIRISKNSCAYLIFFFHCLVTSAQDNRTQLPGLLSGNTYFDATVGYINYHFTNSHLAAGYRATSIRVPHAGVRLILYGYRFNKFLSAQVTYLRPVLWMQFQNINGDKANHSVVMNITGLTVKSSITIKKRLSMYTEAGLAHITRTGFEINDHPAIKNASYLTLQAGVGLNYHLSDKFSLTAYAGWSPANSRQLQPATIFFSGGARYNVHRLSAEREEANRNSGFIFPANLVQVGFTSNVARYGVNDFFANKYFPVFWGGDVRAGKGLTISYQHNIFHGRKVFSIDLGTSFSYWTSDVHQNHFYTLSIFPLFRFTFLQLKTTGFYFNYSVAGPTYISRIRIDEIETGKRFTFQDMMGIGVYAGRRRSMNAEIRIGHYSNGDLFPQNNGIKVPLSFNLGYAF